MIDPRSRLKRILLAIVLLALLVASLWADIALNRDCIVPADDWRAYRCADRASVQPK